MEKSEHIKKLLVSNNDQKIIQGLDLFEQSNYLEPIIDLMNIYQNQKNSEIRSRILFLLSEIKHKAGVKYIVEGLGSIKNYEIAMRINSHIPSMKILLKCGYILNNLMGVFHVTFI